MERHGYDGGFREVLNGYAECKGECAAGCNVCRPCCPAGVDNADCHSFRDVVQRNCQYHHRCSGEIALPSFSVFRMLMQMRYNPVQSQKQECSSPESDDCRQHCHNCIHSAAVLCSYSCLFQCRNQQAPDRCGNHNAGCKPCQRTLHVSSHLFFHEKHAGRSGRGPEKRDHNSLQ